MLMILVLNANTDIEATRTNSDVAVPIMKSELAIRTNPAVIGCLLSKRETSHPDTGNPRSELIGINNRMVPSWASLNPKYVLIVGMRDAQDEKHIPARKKNRLRSTRCRRRLSIYYCTISKVCVPAGNVTTFCAPSDATCTFVSELTSIVSATTRSVALLLDGTTAV